MINDINTVLIANRGVIAKRINKTCKKLGLKTIGIYSSDDKDTKYLYNCDKIVEIQNNKELSGYLNIEEIINIAKNNNASIHPGYGFLSENLNFSEACKNNDIKLIAPSTEIISFSGNKALCINLMKQNNIPVLPSLHFNGNFNELNNFIEEVKFPIIIKPACGGGGIGMNIVNDNNSLEEVIKTSSELSKRYFNDSTLLIERYLPNSKHIEIQLIGDKHGNIYHLFERECSIQRRRQKVVEETLSPSISNEVREKIYQTAISIGKIINLDNVSTIEFLLNEDQFYFLEINPRIQVEHGITEELTGIDLVEWQIRINQNESVKEVEKFQNTNGHCIESRIYAEDPINYLPHPGKIEYFTLPENHSVRIDLGIFQGMEISDKYDPLLLKVITKADNRQNCISKMKHTLRNLDINGDIKVNTMSILSVLDNKEFLNGNYTTNTFEKINTSENIPDWHNSLLSKLLNNEIDSKKSNNKENYSSFWRPTLWKQKI